MDFTCRYTLLRRNGTVSYHDEHLMENTGGVAGHSLEEGDEQVHHQYVLDE